MFDLYCRLATVSLLPVLTGVEGYTDRVSRVTLINVVNNSIQPLYV